MEYLAQYQNQIIVWGVLGLSAGIIAKYLLPGKDKGGLISTALLGVAGSFLGGFMARYFGLGGANLTSGVSLSTVLTAIAGSFVLLVAFRLIRFLV